MIFVHSKFDLVFIVITLHGNIELTWGGGARDFVTQGPSPRKEDETGGLGVRLMRLGEF